MSALDLFCEINYGGTDETRLIYLGTEESGENIVTDHRDLVRPINSNLSEV